MVERQHGARLPRATAEACRACGGLAYLSESTFVELVHDGEVEVHVAEECGHTVTRDVYETCAAPDAELWELA